MRPVTEKVIQRLAYEKLLLANKIQPLRKKITLEEFLEAAKEKPRIYSALAAILLHKPRVFDRLTRDLRRHPEIQAFVDELFLETRPKAKLFGHDKAFYQKSARTFKDYLESQKAKRKSRTLLIRLSEEDLEGLQLLTKQLGTGSVSETIRRIAGEKLRKADIPSPL
ncbi:MAG TPA: hypothetical protein VJR29_04710 [bacterium]|nr:hypothetical protein [bacterium]